MDPRLAFPRVAVAGGPAVEFCVAPGDGDPIVPWMLEHDWIDEPVQRAFQSLVEPGARVLDIGCHLGLFALPAAALGAHVLAVDANARHVELLTEAARRNGFEDRLTVVRAAVTAEPGPVAFVNRSIHGHIRTDADGAAETATVPGATNGDLLERRGWDGADLIKIDIEGGEVAALRGLDAASLPRLVVEGNAPMLHQHGTSLVELRGVLLERGYELLMIDHLRPGILLELADAAAIQPEGVCDYVAVTSRPERLEREWAIEPPLTLEDTARRVSDVALREVDGYRLYVADLLAEGPEWLRDDPGLRSARRALALDASPAVRAAFATRERPGAGAPHAGAPRPREAEAVVVADRLSIARPGEVDRAHGQPGGEPLLTGLDLRIPAGRLVEVRGDAQTATALLRVLAGLVDPLAGRVEAGDGSAGTAAILAAADLAGLEPLLSVEENLAVFGAFAGCDVASVVARGAELAELAGLPDRTAPLVHAGAEGAARVMLAVALAHARPRLLLVDALPPLGAEFAAWARTATASLLNGGGAVVQAGENLLAPAGATIDLRLARAAA